MRHFRPTRLLFILAAICFLNPITAGSSVAQQHYTVDQLLYEWGRPQDSYRLPNGDIAIVYYWEHNFGYRGESCGQKQGPTWLNHLFCGLETFDSLQNGGFRNCETVFMARGQYVINSQVRGNGCHLDQRHSYNGLGYQ